MAILTGFDLTIKSMEKFEEILEWIEKYFENFLIENSSTIKKGYISQRISKEKRDEYQTINNYINIADDLADYVKTKKERNIIEKTTLEMNKKMIFEFKKIFKNEMYSIHSF